MKSFLEFKQINEVLTKASPSSEWIDDFIKSDNPKFAGKSKEERKKMALAAYYAKQNEEVDLDEATDWELKKIHKEYTGLKAKPTSEVLKTHKLLKRVSANYTAAEMGGKEGLISDIMHHRHGKTRMDAYHSLPKKHKESFNEEVELDEAAPSGHKEISASEYDKQLSKMHSGATEHPHGYMKDGKFVGKQHVAINDKGEHITQTYSHADHKHPSLFKIKDKAGKTSHYMKEDLDKACWKGYEAIGTKKKNGKEVPNCVPVKEETLDELSKDTLSSYVKKSFAQGNDLHYDLAHMKGNKATDAERTAVRDKISKRNQGVIKAVSKLKESDIPSYLVAPVPGDKWKSHAVMVHKASKQRALVKRENKKEYEDDGWVEVSPGQRLKKEENEMISYSEFMAKLEESRIDDLRDKQAAEREAKKDAYEAGEKEKSSSTKRNVKGRSYGAGEEGSDDDEDEKKSSEPAVKRGRGRPAGSKSGARV